MKTDCIDKTIEMICEWIKAETEKSEATQPESILPDMVKALTELISARAMQK